MNPSHALDASTPSVAAYAVNDTPVDEARFYAIACDPQKSVAVEACAGAGKTWMLIERMVRALEQGAKPQEILAITFTKKAAGEMRERLQQRLADSDQAQVRAQVLASGRSVQISTFHAWFAQLLKSAPLAWLTEQGLPLSYELLEDTQQVLPKLRQAFYARVLADSALHADVASLAQTIGRSNLDAALVKLLDKRIEFELADQAGLVENAIPGVDEITAKNGTPYALDVAQISQLARALGGNYETKECLQTASALEAWVTAFTARRQADLADLAALDAPAITQNEQEDLCAALLTQEGKPRKIRSKLSEADRQLLEGVQAQVEALLQAQHQQRCWLYQQQMTRAARAWLSCFTHIKQQHGWVDMADLERAGVQLLANSELSGAVQERLDQRLRHVLIDEFQDTNPLQWQAIHAWLSSYAGVGSGALRPSLFIVGDPKQSIYRFRRAEPRVFAAAQRFMQQAFDADVLACDHTRRNSQAVIALVNQAMAAHPLFRPHTTHSEQMGQVLALPLVTKDQTKNQPKTQTQEQTQPQTQTQTQTQTQESLEHAPAKAHGAPLSLKEQEAEQAAAWIAHIADQPQSIMVLSRTHEALERVAQALQKRGIDVLKLEKNKLADVAAVQDILALLDALLSPRRDFELARALKSPLFGWTDEQLMRLRTSQLTHAAARAPDARDAPSWFELLTQTGQAQQGKQGEPAGDKSESEDESECKSEDADEQRTAQTLLHWRNSLLSLPPHDALQAIYDDGQVLAKYRAALPLAIRESSHAALQALLRAALQIEGARFLTAYGFVRAMRSKVQTIKAPTAKAPTAKAVLVDAPASGVWRQRASVQLLTVHGAKGLQADVVLLVDSDPISRKSESMTTLIDWPMELPNPRAFVFLQSESKPPRSLQTLLATDQEARQLEELNTLYVAMTRAKNTLVISASQAHYFNPNSPWQRLHKLCTPVANFAPASTPTPTPATGLEGTLQQTIAPAKTPATKTIAPDRQAALMPLFRAGYIPYAFEADTAAPTATTANAASSQTGERFPADVMGLALHRLLQWHSAGNTTDAAAIDAVSQEFSLDRALAEQAAQCAQIMWQGSAHWVWDEQQIAWQANEYELFFQGRWLRLDRLVQARATGLWWVIDFKSAFAPEQNPALRAQLTRYAQAVSQHLGIDKNQVRAAFITGQGHWVEVPL